MNIERMKELAQELRRPELPVKFGMSDFTSNRTQMAKREIHRHECGTSYCIGGLAVLMFGAEGTHYTDTTSQDLLGLTDEQVEQLFFNEEGYISKATSFEKITRQQAAEAVERMIREEEERRAAQHP